MKIKLHTCIIPCNTTLVKLYCIPVLEENGLQNLLSISSNRHFHGNQSPIEFSFLMEDSLNFPIDKLKTDLFCFSGKKMPADIVPVADGKYECTYYPVDEGKCKVEVTYANQHVPNR